MNCYNLLWIQELGLHHTYIIKLDSKIVVDHFHSHAVDYLELTPKNLFCSNWMVEYTRRKTNVVTHKLTYTSNPLVLSSFQFVLKTFFYR